jgi:hypothetical protein
MAISQHVMEITEGKPAEDCVADDPFNPAGGCPELVAGYVRMACVHEHVREGFLCASHMGRMQSAYCRICHALGHDCPLRGASDADHS